MSVKAAPAAHALAKIKGIDLSNVVGTGKSGFVTVKDINAYMDLPSPSEGDEVETETGLAADVEASTEPSNPLVAAAQEAAQKLNKVIEPKRAHDSDGHFKADDLSTPNVNEAYVQPKKKKGDVVVFRSVVPEVSAFEIRIGQKRIRGVVTGSGVVQWNVAAELAEAVRHHHFAKIQRIIEVK